MPPAKHVRLSDAHAGRGGKLDHSETLVRQFDQLAHDFPAAWSDLPVLVGTAPDDLGITRRIAGDEVMGD